jgi:hypothetical protein
VAEIPPELKDPAVLAYIGVLLATGHRYQPGDPIPTPPKSLTTPLPQLIGYLDDPEIRHYVADHLSSVIDPNANRAARRRKRR